MLACRRGQGLRQTAVSFEPAYLRLLRSGELPERARRAFERLADCDLCARTCHADRRQGPGKAVCRTGALARVDGFGPHHGEEAPLSGTGGSGTIFFSWCNLACDFCQNWAISREGRGEELSPGEIARIMLDLQESGCHNVNLVTPSHVVAPVLAAIAMAARDGLEIPIVYNTGGYDSLTALALLDGVVDIYMPDMKYGDERAARRFSRAPDYPAVNRAAVTQMHRQVGDLVLDEDGIARRGLLVRHLVLPERLAGTEAVVSFLAREISRNTWLNLMDQYRPAYRAFGLPPLDRRVTPAEMREAYALAMRCGLHRFDRPAPAFSDPAALGSPP